MNVFLSLARSLWNALDFGKKSEDEEGHSPAAAPKVRAYRSAFASGARGDGFEAGARGRPVDLTGGVKVKYEVPEEPAPPPEPVQSDFVASLDDLGLLVEAQTAGQPDPSSTADQPPDGFAPLDPSPPPDAPAPLDSFEPAAVVQPLDVFEPAEFVQPLDVFEPAAVAPELPAPAEPVTPPEQPVAAEQPVTAAAIAQPSVAAPQYTVQLLMPAARERAVPAEAVEQFSTLELLDTVAQLSPAEDAVKKQEAVGPGPAPEPPAVAEPSPAAAPSTAVELLTPPR